ncbi:hypothetical protein C5C52_03215 [Rathayibacter sp. AY1E5]|nr:hypothetical protein C5C52_03215 [Rathayibacter sp. AY1E5]
MIAEPLSERGEDQLKVADRVESFLTAAASVGAPGVVMRATRTLADAAVPLAVAVTARTLRM